MQATDKEEGKQVALGTSKLNYLDPRISVAWCVDQAAVPTRDPEEGTGPLSGPSSVPWALWSAQVLPVMGPDWLVCLMLSPGSLVLSARELWGRGRLGWDPELPTQPQRAQPAHCGWGDWVACVPRKRSLSTPPGGHLGCTGGHCLLPVLLPPCCPGLVAVLWVACPGGAGWAAWCPDLCPAPPKNPGLLLAGVRGLGCPWRRSTTRHRGRSSPGLSTWQAKTLNSKRASLCLVGTYFFSPLKQIGEFCTKSCLLCHHTEGGGRPVGCFQVSPPPSGVPWPGWELAWLCAWSQALTWGGPDCPVRGLCLPLPNCPSTGQGPPQTRCTCSLNRWDGGALSATEPVSPGGWVESTCPQERSWQHVGLS